MANYSRASGFMTLIGNWTDKMINNLNIVKEQWDKWDFNISIDDDFSQEWKSLFFRASGRWSVERNLLLIGMWTLTSKSEKVINAYKELCADLAKDNESTYIKVELTEDEPSCEILREATYHVYFSHENVIEGRSILVSKNNLTAKVVEETNYEYTAKNLVKLEFYDCEIQALYASGEITEKEYEAALEVAYRK